MFTKNHEKILLLNHFSGLYIYQKKLKGQK